MIVAELLVRDERGFSVDDGMKSVSANLSALDSANNLGDAVEVEAALVSIAASSIVSIACDSQLMEVIDRK